MNHKHLLAGVAAAAIMAAGNAYAGAHASVEDQVKAQGAAIDALSKEVEALKAGGDGAAKGVKGVNLKVSGHVSRGMTFISDANGASSVNFVDNDASSTRFRFDADTTAGGMTYGARLEGEIESNTSIRVSAVTRANNDGGDDTYGVRQSYVFVRGGFGTLALGHQSEATDGILHNSYNYASLADINPEHLTGALNNVGQTFVAIGDGPRGDSIRYTTPSFGGAAASVSMDQFGDVRAALRYGGDLGGVGILFGIGYDTDSAGTAGADNTVAGSFGLNFGVIAVNGAFGVRFNDATNDEDGFYYVGLAHQGNYMDGGSTGLAIDYSSRTGAGAALNDQSIGIGIVQGMAPGVSAFASFRNHFGADNAGVDGNQVALAGMRVTF